MALFDYLFQEIEWGRSRFLEKSFLEQESRWSMPEAHVATVVVVDEMAIAAEQCGLINMDPQPEPSIEW